jgi:hypothetical protein
MLRFVVSFIIITLNSYQLNSQNIVDLVRYSNTQLSGSARFDAMAGAFGALGADLSSALINPAGYARYSSNQMNIGFNNYVLQTNSTFNGTLTENSQNNFRPNSIGIVASNDVSSNNSGFLYTQIGFSYNRIENFTNNWRYAGQQFHSILDVFCEAANGFAPSELNTYFPMSTSLAWETYAIDQDNSGGYVPRLTMGDMAHNRLISTKGGLSEYTISFSTNYMNKLYLGANWGIRTIRFTENVTHSETLLDNEGVSLLGFDYFTNLKVRGVGHNLKVGAIYLPFEALRLGISLHTPTGFELTEDYGANMIAYHTYGDEILPQSMIPSGNYKYRLRTPAKIIGSIAYISGTRGCVNMDVEYTDYRWANLKSTKDAIYAPTDYYLQNLEADTMLRSVMNVRLGGELVFNAQYFLRGGLGFYPQPYNTNYSDENRATIQYAFGAGIKFKRSSLDFAYRILTRNFNYFAFEYSKTTVNSIIHGINVSYSLNF